MNAPAETQNWISAGSLTDLKESGQRIFKADKKQILLLFRQGEVFACNNRCPHEGYPLAEGTLSDTCTLTCNWHNWKFDLTNGETLVGGDRLRQYPTKVIDDEVFVDLSDLPLAEEMDRLLDNIRQACDDYDYSRIARELARIEKVGGSPLEAVRTAIHHTHNRFEYGMSHAYAAAADWLTLRGEIPADDAARKTICLLEPIGHMAWDTRREDIYAYTSKRLAYDARLLTRAIEHEDEESAVALVRGAIAQDLTFTDIEPALAKAALAHYNDFGHSAIYVTKIGELIEHLGSDIMEPATLALIRELVYATREDLIPEFKGYADALAKWDGTGATEVEGADFIGASINQALEIALKSSGNTDQLYYALLEANAWNYLHVDLKYERHTDLAVAHNVGWLNFTHAITFANAVRTLCTKYPELWPQGLLQMACFLGRNTPYTDAALDTSKWEVANVDEFVSESIDQLFDHGQFEHIVSCHLVKMIVAIRDEVQVAPGEAFVSTVAAAHNRLLNTGIKRRHVMRTANQALEFVARED